MVVSKYMYRLEFIKYCAPLGYLFPKNLLNKFQPTFKLTQPLPIPTHQTFYRENNAIFRITNEKKSALLFAVSLHMETVGVAKKNR